MPISYPRRHLSPHRAWAYLYVDGELTTAEHDHILECETCARLFQVCLKAESFVAVLTELGFGATEKRSA